jgi:hypothetical protein
MPAFECLFFLENFYLFIIEIKRNDLPKDAPKDEMFKWLLIDKDTLETTHLNFNDMDSFGDIEERYFEEGFLKFNNTIGTFIEKYNYTQHPLYRRIEWKMPTSLQNTVEQYLTMQPHHI